MTELAHFDLEATHPGIALNDIWGYTDENGNEYAIIGTTDGTAIVDITIPTAPVEIFWEPGLNSVWRDVKVNGDYAYVTTEAENGLLIINLSPLPGSTALTTNYYYGTPSTNEWEAAHNIWIDENDKAYIFGANGSNNGVIILDISNPMVPVEIGGFDNWYCHDGFVRNDTGYFAHINDGHFSIVDLTDPMNPVVLGTKVTPNSFAHNIWPSDDGKTVFTTDEVSGAYIAAYDVSDPSNIIELDKIQSSPGNNIIPHNAHILGNYIVTSYYTDGVVIHDASNPSNLVEVANYDTSPFSSPDFHGCWGVYPYFSSGVIVASDIDEGLFILGVNWKEATYIHGTVTDISTTNPLFNVEAKIITDNQPDLTNSAGEFQVGIVDETTVDIAFFKVGYYRDTLYNVSLTPGDTTIGDIALTPIPQFSFTLTVYDQNTATPLSNIQYLLEHEYLDYSGVTDGNGQAILNLFYRDDYDVSVGAWGYTTDCGTFFIDDANNTIDMYINSDYYDDFTFDLGWSSFGSATSGLFVRGTPIGVPNGTFGFENPDGDVTGDCSNKCYVTGLDNENVFDGTATLISPVFDLSSATDPFISFQHFYFNFWGPQAPDDTLKITLSNGVSTALLLKDYFNKPNSNMGEWQGNNFRIRDYLPLTPNMQLIITISDIDYPTRNVTEVAIDEFSITEGNVSVDEISKESNYSIYPNPVDDQLNILGTIPTNTNYQIISIDGKIIQSGIINNATISTTQLKKGYYVLRFQTNNTWENHSFIAH